jgi:hypothetical protein
MSGCDSGIREWKTMMGETERAGRDAAEGHLDWAAFRVRVVGEMRGIGVPAEKAAAEARVMEGRMRARIGWMRERFAEMVRLQNQAGDAYCRAMDARPDVDWDSDDAPDLPPPAEEAAAEAILLEIRAAVDGGRWPRHLYFHAV